MRLGSNLTCRLASRSCIVLHTSLCCPRTEWAESGTPPEGVLLVLADSISHTCTDRASGAHATIWLDLLKARSPKCLLSAYEFSKCYHWASMGLVPPRNCDTCVYVVGLQGSDLSKRIRLIIGTCDRIACDGAMSTRK